MAGDADWRVSLTAMVLALVGCAPTPEIVAGNTSVTDYQRSDDFTRFMVGQRGYTEQKLAPMQYEITAKGTSVTSVNRVVKIALTRAAEIGIENKWKFMKIVSERNGMRCLGKIPYGGGEAHRVSSTPEAVINVVYAHERKGPDFKSTDEVFQRFRAELAADQATDGQKAAQVGQAWQRCDAALGRT